MTTREKGTPHLLARTRRACVCVCARSATRQRSRSRRCTGAPERERSQGGLQALAGNGGVSSPAAAGAAPRPCRARRCRAAAVGSDRWRRLGAGAGRTAGRSAAYGCKCAVAAPSQRLCLRACAASFSTACADAMAWGSSDAFPVPCRRRARGRVCACVREPPNGAVRLVDGFPNTLGSVAVCRM